VDRGAPSFDGFIQEHEAYVQALMEAGVEVETLPALEAYPDSVFVEDAALVFADAAIVLRPGAPSRRGEADEIAPELERRFERVLRLQGGFVDGGDVLATPRGVFIGVSGRTNAQGAQALTSLLADLGLQGCAVATPRDVLHLKSDCSLVDEETILATRRLAASGVFGDFRTLVIPQGEEGGANAVRVGDRLLLSSAYPRTAELLANAGHAVVALETDEIAKLDAGLSCLSLRWREGKAVGSRQWGRTEAPEKASARRRSPARSAIACCLAPSAFASHGIVKSVPASGAPPQDADSVVFF
jgi:dimethylargininase